MKSASSSIHPSSRTRSIHPKFSWENSIAVAHAAAAVLHDASHRLYVLTADDPATVYQISTDNHATITARTLTKKAVALGVSNDGKHLYVVVEPTSPATLRQLHVLDTTQTGMPDFNTNPLDLPNSSGSAVTLAVAPDGRLLALVSSQRRCASLARRSRHEPGSRSTELVKNLGADVAGLTLSSDGKLAFVFGPGNQIQSLDLGRRDGHSDRRAACRREAFVDGAGHAAPRRTCSPSPIRPICFFISSRCRRRPR